MSSKDEILKRVQNGYKLPITNAAVVDPQDFILDKEHNVYEEFISKIVSNKAFLVQSSIDTLQDDIQNIINEQKAENLIYPDNLSFDISNLNINNKFKFDKPVDTFKKEIFNYDISIIDARGAVSSHGVVCIASSNTQPRLLSLTPRVCIALIKKDTIVRSLSQMLNKIKEEDGQLPTNVIFISGPSRTSDIELQLVLGVHGSQVFYAVVY